MANEESRQDQITKAKDTLEGFGFVVFPPPEDMGFEEAKPKNDSEEINTSRTAIRTVQALGFDDVEGYLLETFSDRQMPVACCVYLCEVEQDGHCSHGNPSVEMGLQII